MYSQKWVKYWCRFTVCGSDKNACDSGLNKINTRHMGRLIFSSQVNLQACRHHWTLVYIMFMYFHLVSGLDWWGKVFPPDLQSLKEEVRDKPSLPNCLNRAKRYTTHDRSAIQPVSNSLFQTRRFLFRVLTRQLDSSRLCHTRGRVSHPS